MNQRKEINKIPPPLI